MSVSLSVGSGDGEEVVSGRRCTLHYELVLSYLLCAYAKYIILVCSGQLTQQQIGQAVLYAVARKQSHSERDAS